MKHIQKTSKKSKYFVALILTISLAALITASAIITSVMSDRKEESNLDNSAPEILEGEARQSGLTLAYPAVNRKNYIDFLEIKNPTGKFGFMYAEATGEQIFYYFDANGKRHDHLPQIYFEESGFDYAQLFAIDGGDGFGQYSLVDYLFASLQTPYFNERIAFETDSAKRALQMKEFGFVEGEMSQVRFHYKTELGETIVRDVKIGAKSVTGTGFYFIVTNDDGTERPYIYASLNNYYGYAVSNMTKFIKPLLVSEGLPEDNGFGPYLTPGYYQWINELYEIECSCERGECECGGHCYNGCACTDGCTILVDPTVTEKSNVTVYADTFDSSYMSDGYELLEIDIKAYTDALTELKKKPDFKSSYESKNYERVINLLVGKKLGKQSEEIRYSLVFVDNIISLGTSGTATYKYTVKQVNAIVTDSGDVITNGASAGAENLISVTYDVEYTVLENGTATPVRETDRRSVIDLSKLDVSNAIKESLRAAKIGDSLDISFNVTYSKNNSISEKREYVITGIVDIFDAKGKEVDFVSEDSMVSYKYVVYIDGKASEEQRAWIELADIAEGDSLAIKNALKGKKRGTQKIEIAAQNVYYEPFLSFSAYRIARMDYFTESRLVAAFKFQNSSKRDPYYGESLYENLMTGSEKLYGLNSSACEQVAVMLGGLSETSTTATAAGLVGDEVVAVGITPEIKRQYGLYAHTIYFEIPRGIKAYDGSLPSDKDSMVSDLDDYTFINTLGFTLYISDVDPETNMRYIASDLYDIVTRVPAKDFAFLDYDFETFWARRSIILMDIVHISDFSIELNMSDYKGAYNFELTHPAEDEKALGVFVTIGNSQEALNYTDNKLLQFIQNPANQDYLYQGGTSLKTFYERMSDASVEDYKNALPDSLGADRFKAAIRLIYFTSYVDVLPEELKDGAMSPDKCLVRMRLKLDESSPNASPYTYVYEYYRVDDRRVLVSIHQETESGEEVTERISSFYISTFAFKKIVNNFVGLLNAEVINTDIGYPDESVEN